MVITVLLAVTHAKGRRAYVNHVLNSIVVVVRIYLDSRLNVMIARSNVTAVVVHLKRKKTYVISVWRCLINMRNSVRPLKVLIL